MLPKSLGMLLVYPKRMAVAVKPKEAFLKNGIVLNYIKVIKQSYISGDLRVKIVQSYSSSFYGSQPGLDIGLVGPVARGASRFENLLAPQKTYWPGGPVDLKTYWPPKKLTGPYPGYFLGIIRYGPMGPCQ